MKLDSIVAKYMKIWIWSILFGATSTVTYALLSSFGDYHWGILAWATASFAFFGMVLTLKSFQELFVFFRKAIIPSLFHNREGDFSKEELGQHSATLLKAFQYLIFATVVVFATKILGVVLAGFTNFG